MRVLVVGGSGYVAGLFLPALAARHPTRILDRRPPPDGPAEVEYLAGDATDHADLRRASAGMDTVVHCAMGSTAWRTPAGAADAFDVNVKSVHLTLLAARSNGVPHAVYISSMSVYRRLTARRLDESVPPDATDLYGLTKRLGEQVCQAATVRWGMSVNILRLAWPTPDGMWPAWAPDGQPVRRRAAGGSPIDATAASDLSSAVLAALAHRDGCQIFTISGDRSAGLWSTAKAGEVLGWGPTFPRPAPETP
ncbi:MAG: NAD(P)-dependent oxidoreductase [Actinobacteria bacterium]|nr:MAG: NAD(P)-dependent oxidoreductase [Actinomycetota bacterium]